MSQHPAVSPFAFAVKPIARVLALVFIVAAVATPSPAHAVEPALATAEVAANNYFPELEHNVADVVGTFTGGASFAANFLANFEQTGGVERWGYPTSAIFEETPGTLTQYYQRGVIDWRPPLSGGAHTFLRRLAWDYLGGGLGGSVDQGVEPGLTNDNPGEGFGPWGHKVANVSVEGVEIGFADYFHRLGGVDSFGFPKTDARRDDHPQTVLHDPTRSVDSRIRQYFQAAVLEYHPESSHAPVKLRLVGDTLRDSRYPDDAWRRYLAFGPEEPFAVGDGIEMKLPKRLGPHGSSVDDVAAFLEPSLLRVETDLGCGAGFFVTESGYVVTTWNLAGSALTIHVSNSRGYVAGAQLITGNAELNVALLKVPGDNHIPVIWGDSSELDAQVELVGMGYDSAQVGNVGGIGCQSEPTTTTITLRDTSVLRWQGIRPRINVGHIGGPVASRAGQVVGVMTTRYAGVGTIDDMIPTAEAQPFVATWLDELSRGETPTLPYRKRFDRIVLAERDRMTCPGSPDAPGAIWVEGSQIELTATVELKHKRGPAGLLRFTAEDYVGSSQHDFVYFRAFASGRDFGNLEWIRLKSGSYTTLREGRHADIASGRPFHIRFIYESGSVVLYINGKIAHTESGLPYGESITLSLECLAATGSPDMYYHDVRITGFLWPEIW